jgi:hypothetical protein
MLAILSPFLGIIGSLLPSIVRIFERKLELKHEIELTKIKLDAAERQADLTYNIEMVKGDAISRQSALDHDKSLDGGIFINALRSSVRPIVTYIFFITFLAVKISAAYVMLTTGQSVPEMLDAVWDMETMALFSTIIAFWFGSRAIEKQDRNTIPQAQVTITTTPKKNK